MQRSDIVRKAIYKAKYDRNDIDIKKGQEAVCLVHGMFGYQDGDEAGTTAVVELEDGKVIEVMPDNLQFIKEDVIMPLQFEELKSNLAGTMWRAKVPGGWLVKDVQDVISDSDSQHLYGNGYEWRSSICFVPDENHNW
jgi:hypothetical protein